MNVKEDIATYFEIFKCLDTLLHNYKFTILAVKNEKRPDKNRVRKIMLPLILAQENEALDFARKINSEFGDNGFFSRPSISEIVRACDTQTLDYYIAKANEYEEMIRMLDTILKDFEAEHKSDKTIKFLSSESAPKDGLTEPAIGGIFSYLSSCKFYLKNFRKAVSDLHSSFDKDNGQFKVMRKSMALDRSLFALKPKEIIEDLMKKGILKNMNEEGVQLESEILEAFLFGGPDVHYPKKIYVQKKAKIAFYNFINSLFTRLSRTDVVISLDWFCASNGDDLSRKTLTNGQNVGSDDSRMLVTSYLSQNDKKVHTGEYMKK